MVKDELAMVNGGSAALRAICNPRFDGARKKEEEEETVRLRRRGSRTCEGLTFDKAEDLNGYEVRTNAIAFEPHLRIDPTKTGLQRFSGDNGEILKIVLEKLNASVRVRVYNGTVYDLGGIDSHGSTVGMMADLATGEVDMGMNARGLHNTWKIEYVSLHKKVYKEELLRLKAYIEE
ncbi:hypothetical protein WN51_01985 [Melipona quadrifasciata]|uniref:Uncharacterized protein n=1 Tax=Melipona quadrifasciata TaxID=166423 RepID=A0A0M9AAS0_9HYME|nr:hypothetical protein WN51_01985 [Melipona quadrifasciata]